jgi:ribonuclease P/MRP protein subunit POP8
MDNVGDDASMADSPGRKRKQKNRKGHEISIKTIKAPLFSYACLELISDSTSQIELDDLTLRSYITSSLTQFLGLTGSAISFDILKVEGRECWIRLPREDISLFLAAVGGWIGANEIDGKIGWKVKGNGNWLSVLVGKNGAEKTWNK